MVAVECAHAARRCDLVRMLVNAGANVNATRNAVEPDEDQIPARGLYGYTDPTDDETALEIACKRPGHNENEVILYWLTISIFQIIWSASSSLSKLVRTLCISSAPQQLLRKSTPTKFCFGCSGREQILTRFVLFERSTSRVFKFYKLPGVMLRQLGQNVCDDAISKFMLYYAN